MHSSRVTDSPKSTHRLTALEKASERLTAMGRDSPTHRSDSPLRLTASLHVFITSEVSLLRYRTCSSRLGAHEKTSLPQKLFSHPLTHCNQLTDSPQSEHRLTPVGSPTHRRRLTDSLKPTHQNRLTDSPTHPIDSPTHRLTAPKKASERLTSTMHKGKTILFEKLIFFV